MIRRKFLQGLAFLPFAPGALTQERVDKVTHRNRYVIYTDDEPSIQAALDKAARYKIPQVKLNPTVTYEISETLIIPAETELDGGGRGLTSNAPTSPQHRAKLLAVGALDPMIRLSHFATVRGCKIDGNMRAVGAVLAQDVIYTNVYDNLICCVTDYGLRYGGCVFATIKSNTFNQIGGYGLDALKAHGTTGYYGINVGISERNEWKGARGLMRLEGILTSVSDDFETAATPEPVVTVGGAAQSQLVMYAPYFEISKSAQYTIRAIRVTADSHLTLSGGQAYGHVADPNAIFLEAQQAAHLDITGAIIRRFATVFSGTVRATASVHIAGLRMTDYTLANGFTNLAGAETVFCAWPGAKVGA